MMPKSLVSEEELLGEDIARLDRDHPGWDERAKIAEAESVLLAGMDFEVVASIYGAPIAAQALEEVSRKRKK